MKFLKNIIRGCLCVLMASTVLTSCDYLDVVPPEQPNLSDATGTYMHALGFLYSCYKGIEVTEVPWTKYLHEEVASTDEIVLPYVWSTDGLWDNYACNTVNATPSNHNWIWGDTYRFIGQCLLFLQELEKIDPSLVPEKTLNEWEAEAKFLIAYYHFCTLKRYGPIPITDHYLSMDAMPNEYCGRYHFDYCVDWIAKQLDEAANVLPAYREKADEWGRATSVIAKSIKARMLLYAASPLWNGSFPYPDWKNKNFETPGYGKELVSKTYDPKKWERAKLACEEALLLAEGEGQIELYDDEDFYQNKQLELPYVPGVTDGDIKEEEKEKFLKTVMKMRYLVSSRITDGNKEIIWGNWNFSMSDSYARLPLRILQYPNREWWSGWGGVSPTLNTVEMFYTKNGKLPENDPDYTPKSEWLQSSGVKHRVTNWLQEEKVFDIAKLHINREPRFYAWIAFDGGDYGSKLMDGRPLTLDMRNSQLQGYDPKGMQRNYSPTGYLTQKFFDPASQFNTSSATDWTMNPAILIRGAELYLNLAECYAALGDVPNAIKYLNPIRKRAYVPELTEEDVTPDMPIMKWVRSERFIELWGEGHRFFDVRRWKLGHECFGTNVRRGLNAMQVDPTYETFYQSTVIPYPYVWVNKLYIDPVHYGELYKNPQMIQAPDF